MTSLPFSKMEGCGNDFVVVYRHELPAAASSNSAIRLCDRSSGIGADGVLVIDWGPSLREADRSAGALARMTVWNADGSIAEMCGNGLRCVVRRLQEDSRFPGSSAHILTGAGLMPVSLEGEPLGGISHEELLRVARDALDVQFERWRGESARRRGGW